MHELDRKAELNNREAVSEVVDYLSYVRFGDESKKMLDAGSFDVERDSHLANRLRILALHEAIIEFERTPPLARLGVRRRIKELFDDLQIRLSARFSPSGGFEVGDEFRKSTWLDMQIDISREALLSVLPSEYREGEPYRPETVEVFRDSVMKTFLASGSSVAADPAHRQLAHARKALLSVLTPTGEIDNQAMLQQLRHLNAFPRSLQNFIDTLEERTIPLPKIILRRREAAKTDGQSAILAPAANSRGLGGFSAAPPLPRLPDATATAGANGDSSGTGPRNVAAIEYDEERGSSDEEPIRKRLKKTRKALVPRTPIPPLPVARVTSDGEDGDGSEEGAPDEATLNRLRHTVKQEGAPGTPAARADGTEARAPRRRTRFSVIEEENLRQGVRDFGLGQWELIRKSFWFNGRTNVDLKDKWRNMMKKEERERKRAEAAEAAEAAERQVEANQSDSGDNDAQANNETAQEGA